eukprot:CAMPEP_0194073952 /NCGR_PEP_ID=MMETSP0149-20130528/1167_1 /TAXON_ID=122233 /ORGANISM="Chaetoceros debilis, Strain MM31A-1" /LENGTH=325 /DNA_ID=CAMNT_0038754015 /DNA_START=198 /DNA_END=1175 /DNA_ORIENTATION=-
MIIEMDPQRSSRYMAESASEPVVGLQQPGENNNNKITPIHFKPASGCDDATDFVVRCFIARLKMGFRIKKHSNHARSGERILILHPDGISLSWKRTRDNPRSKIKLKKDKLPRFDLRLCTEIRHAGSIDTLDPRFTGTSVLRKKIDVEEKNLSFSLIFPERTIDITTLDRDQYIVLVQGFSALCYRLQLSSMSIGAANKNSYRSNFMPMQTDYSFGKTHGIDEYSKHSSSASTKPSDSSEESTCTGNLSRLAVKDHTHTTKLHSYSQDFDYSELVNYSYSSFGGDGGEDLNVDAEKESSLITPTSIKESCNVTSMFLYTRYFSWF